MSFPTCLKPLVENDTWCELFDMKIYFYSPADKTRFLMKVFFHLTSIYKFGFKKFGDCQLVSQKTVVCR